MNQSSSRKKVFTLVHGTFAPNAAWTQEHSEFYRVLQQQLGGQTIHRRITWYGFLGSGANNGHDYRIAGGTTLAEALRASFCEFPDAEHWVIAHSHGGNVAFYALRDREVACRLDGIVTMATPFIQCKPRTYSDSVIKLWAFLPMPLSLLPLLVLSDTLAHYVFGVSGKTADFLTLTGTLIGETLLFILYCNSEQLPATLSARQKATIEKLTLPTPTRQRVLCLSILGDEARGLLKGMYMIAAWPHWLWDGLIYMLLMLVIFVLALIFGDAFLSSMSGITGLARLKGALGAALGWGMLIGYVNLLVMAILPKLTRALGIGFGQESLVDNLLVDIRSEVIPGDVPGLIHKQFPKVPGSSLMHSHLYQDSKVISVIAKFIAGQPISQDGK